MTRPTDAEVYARHPDLQMADAAAKMWTEQQASDAETIARQSPRTVPASEESMSIQDAAAAHYAAQLDDASEGGQ